MTSFDNQGVLQHIRLMNQRHAIVIEKTVTGFSAFVPDLPGCFATRHDKQEVEAEKKGDIMFHINGMRKDDLPEPTPTSITEHVDA